MAPNTFPVSGKYRLVSSENQKEVMARMGVSSMLLKVIGAVSEVEFKELGNNKYKMSLSSRLASHSQEFEMGVPFEEKLGMTSKHANMTTINWSAEPNVWHGRSVPKPGSSTRGALEVRRFTADGMEVEFECDGVKSREVFKRV